MGELIVDCFAGGGGVSTGIEMALGRSPDIAINHDAIALAMHKANHPNTHHLNSNIFKVIPSEACAGRPIGMLWLSPDCFVPGTLVLTPGGLVPIETISVGDNVLTHRGRWRPVTSTMTREADTVEVRGQGHYGLITTPSHLFYSKVITKRWPRGKNGKGRRPGLQRTLVENPYWPAADKMAGKLWATPKAFPGAWMPLPDVTVSDDFFYFLGRWIGDGSINKGDVEICCGTKECDEFAQWIAEHPLRDSDGSVIPYRVVDHGSSRLFVWGSAALVRWLQQEVRTGSENKRLPLWCLSMPRSWREALLSGYVDADGYVDPAWVFQTSSVSKALSIGVRLLVTGLGYATSLYRTPGGAGQIEGRSFIARDSYVVRWRPDNQKETTFSDTLHTFAAVKEVQPAGLRTVVSLQVEEDESFVADGIVVHNCKHFSRAKGAKPVEKRIRGLAWVALHWAQLPPWQRPRVIFLENVPEFLTWGPLLADGRPDPERKGEEFQKFVKVLKRAGYSQVEWQTVRMCNYGDPTIRQRLCLIARCDGEPIVWPAHTNGDPKSDAVIAGKLPAWRTAAEDVIDWSIPCPSIFLSKTEIKQLYDEFGIRVQRPLKPKTMARIFKGLVRFVIECADPFIIPVTHAGDLRSHSSKEPVRTQTGAKRGEHALVVPYMVPRYGERGGAGKTALVSAFLAKHFGGHETPGWPPEHPISTVTAQDHHAVVSAGLLNLKGSERRGGPIEAPTPALTAQGGHLAEVRAFLIKFYKTGGQHQDARDPLHTLTAKARIGVVTVHGEDYQIADIGMRMLTPRERFNAHSFPSDYKIDILVPRTVKGVTVMKPITAEEQGRMVGNSVPCRFVKAVVAANYRPRTAAERKPWEDLTLEAAE